MNKLQLALFAGATAAALAAPAHAVVVTVNLNAAPIAITNSIDGIYLNVVTGVSGASGAVVTGWDINPYNNGAGLTFYGAASPSGILATGTAGTLAVAQSLMVGSIISPTATTGFYNQFQTVGTAFQSAAGTYFVGFRFQNEATGAANVGYLQLNITGTSGFPAFITGYAYDNNAASSITVSRINPVPEASTYAMMGLGLAAIAGLTARRRRAA